MIKTRRTFAAIVAGAAAAAALSLAPAAAADLDLDDYVRVSNENGVVHIGTGIPGQPLVGASLNTNTGQVCVGFSYQMPFCTFDSALSGAIATSSIPSPVWVDADNSDGSIGAGVRIGTGSIVGVRYYSTTGQVCVGIGMQRPFCAVIA